MLEYNLISLGDLLSNDFDENKIVSVFEKFSCQFETELEDFLLNDSIKYEKAGFGKTFLFLDSERLKNEELSIMAYYTIGHSSVDISNIKGKSRRKMLGSYPGRDNLTNLATFMIAQLGRSDKYSSEDLSGATILSECYNSLSIAAKIIGGNIVSLECREHMYSKFYEKQGYRKLTDKLSEKKLYSLYRKVDFEEYWGKSN